MKIILSGGGTIGSVSPLLAIYEEVKQRQTAADFLWLATKNGPERKLVKSYQIPLKGISSGKLRRYFSFQNFLDPFRIFLGFIQSILVIIKYKPNLILSAGGFVSVPTVWAAWLLRVPVMIHQQDMRAGLANKLMAPFAKIITITFKESLKDFPASKTVLVGNPVRAEILQGNKDAGYEFFKFDSSLPILLVTGGGTGARAVNQIVEASAEELTQFCQVIHLTGGKTAVDINNPRYKSFTFLTEQLKNAFAIADLVVTRAGMSALTELSALAKPSIIIPMPNSHQEENANEFFKNNAAAVINENNLTPEGFTAAVKELLESPEDLETFRRNMPKVINVNAAKTIVDMIV